MTVDKTLARVMSKESSHKDGKTIINHVMLAFNT